MPAQYELLTALLAGMLRFNLVSAASLLEHVFRAYRQILKNRHLGTKTSASTYSHSSVKHSLKPLFIRLTVRDMFSLCNFLSLSYSSISFADIYIIRNM